MVQTQIFSGLLDEAVYKKELTGRVFEDFEVELVRNPRLGNVIPGLDGLRKIRLKGSQMGKRGGFRVIYLDIPEIERLYLILIYPKSFKEDLSSEEKRQLKKMVKKLKEDCLS